MDFAARKVVDQGTI